MMDTPLFAFGQPHRPIPTTVQARLQTKQRMPLMLPPEAVDPWLTGTPEEASSLLVRYPCADAALGSVLLANLVPTNQGDSQKIDRSELRDAMPRAVSLYFELRPRVVVPMDKRISRLLIEEFGRHGSTIESGPTETSVPAKSQSYPFYRPAAWRLSTSFGPLMVAESPQHPSKRNFYDPDVLDASLGTVLTEALGVHR